MQSSWILLTVIEIVSLGLFRQPRTFGEDKLVGYLVHALARICQCGNMRVHPDVMEAERYYVDLAAAFIRGKLAETAGLSSQETIRAGLAAGCPSLSSTSFSIGGKSLVLPRLIGWIGSSSSDKKFKTRV